METVLIIVFPDGMILVEPRTRQLAEKFGIDLEAERRVLGQGIKTADSMRLTLFQSEIILKKE